MKCVWFPLLTLYLIFSTTRLICLIFFCLFFLFTLSLLKGKIFLHYYVRKVWFAEYKLSLLFSEFIFSIFYLILSVSSFVHISRSWKVRYFFITVSEKYGLQDIKIYMRSTDLNARASSFSLFPVARWCRNEGIMSLGADANVNSCVRFVVIDARVYRSSFRSPYTPYLVPCSLLFCTRVERRKREKTARSYVSA